MDYTMMPSDPPCPHVTPRYDGALMAPCDICCPPDPDRHAGIHFTWGRDQFHGPTIREQTDEMFANAKKYGNDTPTYEGRRWI